MGNGTESKMTANSLQALLSQAVRCLNAGRFAEAEELCRRVLSVRKREPNALHFLGIVALQSRRPEEAVGHLTEATSSDRRNPDLLCTLAGALMECGREREARKALNRALRLAPAHTQAQYNLGLVEMRREDFSIAARHFEKVVKSNPQHLDALNNLGIAQIQLKECDAAVQAFTSVLSRQPDHHRARRNLANALIELDRYEDALTEFDALLSNDDTVASDHFHRAIALGKARRRPEAIVAYNRAIEIDPNYVDAHNNLNRLLWMTGEFHVALDHISRAMELNPDNDKLRLNAALTYAEAGQGGKAIDYYQKVLQNTRDNHAANIGVVRELQNLGRFTDADNFIDNAQKDITDPEVKVLLECQRLIRSKGVSDDEIEVLESWLESADSDTLNRSVVLNSIGKVLESRGEPDAAFEQFSAAASLRNARVHYDADAHDENVDRIIETFDESLIRLLSKHGSSDDRVIFIVGMPRSGTTLVEQILASHDDVDALGELRNLSFAVEDKLSHDMGGIPYPKSFRNIDGMQLQAVQRYYLDYLDRVSPSVRFVVDKMPTNSKYVGAIAVLFPNARIVHCRRQPEATGVSIFMQNFNDEHGYSFDLYNIGRRYRTYRRLMAHWRALLPEMMLEFDYENLIGDQEHASRELLAHCRLDWKDDVLDFSNTERSVRTASSWQVRQRLYGQRVEGWRKFEAHLGPFYAGLAGESRG